MFRQTKHWGGEKLNVSSKKERSYNYAKLRARTVEMSLRDKDVAAASQMAPATYSLKLNGKGEFTQAEICDICALLHIDAADIPLYFFAHSV